MTSCRICLIAWVIAIAAIAAVLAPMTARARRAEARADSALAVFTAVAADARELDRLRVGRDNHVDQAGPEAAPVQLAPAVSATLAACGLPASVLSSLSPESESIEQVAPRDGSASPPQTVRLIRKRATLVLTPITLPQLGRFLHDWRGRSPDWTVARLDVEPRGAGEKGAGVTPGADLPLRVTLSIESLRAAERGR